MYLKIKNLVISGILYLGLYVAVILFISNCCFHMLRGSISGLFRSEGCLEITHSNHIECINNNYVYLDRYAKVGISFANVGIILCMLYSIFGIRIDYVEKSIINELGITLYSSGDDLAIIETDGGISSVSVKTSDDGILKRAESIMGSSENRTSYRFKATSTGFVLER